MATKDKEQPAQELSGYTKDQIVNSAKYAQHRDIVLAFLDEDKTYSFDQVDQIIKGFLGRSVK